MCGIFGIQKKRDSNICLGKAVSVMGKLLAHRGPDGQGFWENKEMGVAFGHVRLSIIDLATGNQPMTDGSGNWITFNGEIYNYVELRQELGTHNFRTTSDTEVILQAYRRWGEDCVKHLRGMFAFAIWDDQRKKLFCARDRFGIKPFYFADTAYGFVFASEAKALLPFLDGVETDLAGLKDYLTFQFCLDGKTLFKGIRELKPAHVLTAGPDEVRSQRYWQVYYDLDFEHTESYFRRQIEELMAESVKLHRRSDVPIGGYISGGLDSSIVASLACQDGSGDFVGFTGKFTQFPGYDESAYARDVADKNSFPLYEADITSGDFLDNIRKLIYHLDYPVAGPGSFPQYMVSAMAAKHRKVVLGGQGGDEVFGGYVRYLIAYFEQCIKAAIDGNMHNGNYVVTYESIIPNLTVLKNYKPMMQQFWQEGLFEDLDRRYFRLINRAPDLADEVNWQYLEDYSPFETFQKIFRASNVQKESYFDSMTHFDFKTLLPALLHVEDRVSMAHGMESRVPFLDHPLIEMAATIPSDTKFKNGTLKNLLLNTFADKLPSSVTQRKDKMGFPVPFNEWLKNDLRDFVQDIFSSQKVLSRDLINNKVVLQRLQKEPRFGRKVWGLLCLEIWQQEYHDQANYYKDMLKEELAK